MHLCLFTALSSSLYRWSLWHSQGWTHCVLSLSTSNCVISFFIFYFLPQNLFATQQFGLFMSCLIAWNGCKWNRHKPVCLSVIVWGLWACAMGVSLCVSVCPHVCVFGCCGWVQAMCTPFDEDNMCVHVCVLICYQCLFGVKSPCLWGC